MVSIAREHRINEQIRVREVRVISDTGEQLGIMPTRQALELARERGLDLVEVAPQAVPPVCRLMDYGKFRYQQAKREREARKAQKEIEISEIRLRPRIAEHDLQAKLRRIREFLDDGDKVKLTVMFRGRELGRPEQGLNLLKNIVEQVKDLAKIETPPALEGRFLTLVLAPLPKKEARPAKPAREMAHAQEST
ncbi:Translation initiation factor IF-3 [bacterium HR23]|nr:Translation initiation factor IF-3 [bacterium HR23]